ncbi:MAG: hypothetical protein U0401_31925 [Anaerolineae bacterium]
MTRIKIQHNVEQAWMSVEWLYDETRPGWVKIQADNGEPEWIPEGSVHPADQVVLRVERLARKRYEWVPKEDLEDGGKGA